MAVPIAAPPLSDFPPGPTLMDCFLLAGKPSGGDSQAKKKSTQAL